jgi:hypothetical protein
MTLAEYIAEGIKISSLPTSGRESLIYKKSQNKYTDGEQLHSKGAIRKDAYTGDGFTKGSYNKYREDENDRAYDNRGVDANNAGSGRRKGSRVSGHNFYEAGKDEFIRTRSEVEGGSRRVEELPSRGREEGMGNKGHFRAYRDSNRWDEKRLNDGRGIIKGGKDGRGGETSDYFRKLASQDQYKSGENDRTYDRKGVEENDAKSNRGRHKNDYFGRESNYFTKQRSEVKFTPDEQEHNKF